MYGMCALRTTRIEMLNFHECMCTQNVQQLSPYTISRVCNRPIHRSTYVTRFAKTRHNDAILEIQIFASVSSIYLKLCSVVISMLYCKYFSSYKAR